MTYSYLDRWSHIYHVVCILVDSIYQISDTEIAFAWFTDTSIHIQIKWTPVVSILTDQFLSGRLE
jgi:hypothetical protein